MREIKFRAWDEREKKMYFPAELIQYGNVEVGYLDGSGCPKGKPDVLMQYTGLKDKNGKEIYEGDILFPGRREVRFGEYGTEVEQGTGFMTYSHDAKEPWKIPFSFAHRQAEGSKVIGNIYENPELIK